MKKITCVVLISIFSVLILFASGKPEATPAKGKELITLTLWHHHPDPDGAVFQKYVERFNKENEGSIKIISEFVPRQELMKQYSIGAVSGELPDIGTVDNPEHASLSAMGILTDITAYYKAWDSAKFLQGPIDSCKLDGKIYGLPESSNCLALIYDVDMLQNANVKVPTTWSELMVACQKLTDKSKGVYGLAICALNNEAGTFQFIPWLESAGKFNDLTSKGSMSALQLLKDLVDKGYMSKEVISWSQSDVQKQFSAGSAAMMISGPWNIPAIMKDSPNKNWNVAKVPRSDDGVHASCLGGENLVICKGANVDAAWKFLSWFCSKEISEQFTSEIRKFSPRSDVDGKKQYSAEPKMTVYTEVMPTAKPRGPHPQWPRISAAIYTAVQEVLTGQKDVATSLSEAQVKINNIK